MRDIIFGGKAIHNNKWVYGNFIHSANLAGNSNEFRIRDINSGAESDVDPNTVGQFIGMEDRKTISIKEGDIVQDYVSKVRFQVVFTDYANFGLKAIGVQALKDYEYETIDSAYAATTLRIIGNIHDNPELLK